jgi:AraC-like DNA-binding protein
MSDSAAALERATAGFTGTTNKIDLSSEILRLLSDAADCIGSDQASAIDLIERASKLLRPTNEGSRKAPEAVVAGGLAPWQVKRVNLHIERSISRQITIEELSQLANLSSSYFSTAFKVSYGTSPHNYIISRRVEHAKRLMLEGNAPLCEIALDCGLADQAHLSRIFRRVTNSTPSAWRRYRISASRAADEA